MRLALIPLSLLLSVSPAIAQSDGAFTLRSSSERDDRVNLNLQYNDGRSNYGRTIERREFSDVKPDGERITFVLRRAAGTFRFEGRGSMDRASGWFEFSPDASFQREMERLGFAGLDTKALFVFALEDLSPEKVKQLQALVSDRLDTDQLIRMINHGAGLTYVQAMTEAGYKKLSSDEYVRARDHGVSTSYVREMGELGIKLPLNDLVRLRDHGVSVEYVRAMRAAGHDVSPEDLVRARDHGVSADFIKRMAALGHDKLPLNTYVKMRDHGVSAEYVEDMRDAGMTALSADELIRLRDHGISANYVKRMRELFKETPTAEQIIRLRTRGDIGR